jgi:hypothetical protein
MRILLAPTFDLAKGIRAQLSICAQYPEGTTVEGTQYTVMTTKTTELMGCLDENIPKVGFDGDAIILINQIDLNVLGAIERALRIIPLDDNEKKFWKLVAFVEANGLDKIEDYPEHTKESTNQMLAWECWKGEHFKKYQIDVITDVTRDIIQLLEIVEHITSYDEDFIYLAFYYALKSQDAHSEIV